MKNFSECPVKLSLPEIIKNGKKINLSFNILSKPGRISTAVVDEIKLADVLGNVYDYEITGACKRNDQNLNNLSFEVTLYNSGMLVFRGSNLIISILTSEGYKFFVKYKISNTDKLVLEDVSSQLMGDDDNDKFDEEISDDEPYNSDDEADEDDESDESEEDYYTDNESEDNHAYDSDYKESYTDHNITSGLHPTILKYRNAILREMYFLKNGGGKKYKITNGTLLSRKNGISTYSFEMEAELYLSDDAPITFESGEREANGLVVSCESFQIIINVDRDFGLSVSQGFISVEPWKLLEAIANNLEYISKSHHIAMKLIDQGPMLSTLNNISSIPRGQDAAIKQALSNDITVIWGPPGTGKTYTMAKIAISAILNNKTVLVVSHSNVSVDGIVKETVAQAKAAGLDNLLEDGQILRYGYVRDGILSKDPNAVAYNYVLGHRPDLKRELERLIEKRKEIKANGDFHTSKGSEVEQKLKEARQNIREAEKYYAEKAKFLATTISKVTVDKTLKHNNYDVVMFDEVSMAYIPQILCAAKKANEKLVLVGDFKQLPPIAQSEAQTTLCEDIFEFLGISKMGNMYAHPWLVMLDEQRRMYPTISEFPNKYIYNSLLKDHESVLTNRDDIISREPLYNNSINMIDLLGTYCATMKNSDNSRFNIVSAIVSFLSALSGEDDGQKSIGIITPYAAQTRLIRAMIQDHKEAEKTSIECSTVHQFQGSQRDVIIFDAVESYPSSRVGFLMGKSMSSVSRLVNVAVTRARGKLVVVANAKYWEMRYGSTGHIFYKLVQYLQNKGNVVSTHEKKLQNYIKQLPDTKKIKNYQDDEEAISAFKKDVNRAKDRIIISIPDGTLYEQYADPVLEAVLEARRNGIRILCKTNGYENLPDSWKELAWASDNAVFPIIMIDDSVMWYGLPKSKGMFKDGNTGFVTVCQTIYRIKGEHTLELIRVFSELELRDLDGNKTALLEKNGLSLGTTSSGKSSNGESDDTGEEATGLGAYVQKHEKCINCRQPMTLMRSKRGKSYLKCKACKETAFLTPEVANEYIDIYQATCPIHKCGVTAKLGPYGLYIRCDYGHYLKPDEI
ncbi:Part of AAA domain-containing protein [Butyrivibrio fibrisolvens DSM 3071]|uniref:Part of AAA domain-containing protein n=3 Tax=Butyrivibrio fibrisolvens TaxID=831 RepID=A0A1M5X0T5_BUTFI|nr:AAA domain-containing protein [Butyrivibrio fibrisolvens]SHH92763.1 Part of AAA domain-containing protein [Butyrivibrio fibrisolvens DSM 3071]